MIQENTITNDNLLVNLSDSIYGEDAAQIKKSLSGYIDKGQRNFVVDLTDVDYIDSSGLGTLVAIQKRALQHGDRLIIKGLTGLVKNLFELTRLTKVFEIQ